MDCIENLETMFNKKMNVLRVVLGKALKECEQLMKKHSETSAKNDQLSEECRRYSEEFKRMEEKIATLKHEIDERNRQASFTHYQVRWLPFT